jgi:hypothetical protein
MKRKDDEPRAVAPDFGRYGNFGREQVEAMESAMFQQMTAGAGKPMTYGAVKKPSK